MRKLVTGVSVLAISLLGVAALAGSASAATTFQLNLSQSTAFSLLGYWCGGISEQSFVTGFDPTSGYPVGDVYMSTTCNGSGRGGHSTTHTAWGSVTWDFTATVVSDALLTSAPTVDPAFSAFDANGNEIYNSANNAYLTYGPGFAPTPRVTSISTTAGPTSGGTSVTIDGTGFTNATAVNFGTTAITSFTITGDTSITATSPPEGPGTVDVTVTSPGGTSSTASNLQFTYVAPPTVTGLSPNNGGINGGTYVTITGTNLSTATAVNFGDTAAGFWVNSDTSLTAISPGEGNPDTVSVSVVTIGGTSTPTPADVFTYSTGGCTGVCASSVQCAKLTGSATGTMTISKCTPKVAGNKSATATAFGSTVTWKSSGQTTDESNGMSSPGQGACAAGSTEEDISGNVTGGTSTYTAVGDVVSAQICVSSSGKLSLVKGTTYSV
ncbi:MAG TPA: IPT/TIG domain-containing protein [Acidimicrobiales bacterium]|nr:IPT/TIG domain-containing protein [Acidimicrobiales bacterium]